jgi:hypothetical protein
LVPAVQRQPAVSMANPEPRIVSVSLVTVVVLHANLAVSDEWMPSTKLLFAVVPCVTDCELKLVP